MKRSILLVFLIIQITFVTMVFSHTSSDGRYVIHTSDQRVFILDTQTGEAWRYMGLHFQRVYYAKEITGGNFIMETDPQKLTIRETEAVVPD
ncbi:hypothetical protein ACFL1T_04160 [Chlamydiota bacterium]